MSKEIVIIDTETTGFSPGKCQIIEIGAIKVDAETLEIVDEYSCLIDIDENVPPFITQLTGITTNMLRQNGIHIEMGLNKLNDFCQNNVIYAHNASFDKRFIRYFLTKCNINYFETAWNDTISIFRHTWPNRKTYKLDSLIRDFNLATKEDHRAISDAKHTLTLMKIARQEGGRYE